ncbi:protein disulfide isomerase [Coemansia reversa NRRL 1564]|uniref:protein disulfide-isomerase n=1 Tax=Coemansia reversa (strain ATCC 12441 / NRRL 1564) TaxID=763665 RepID=A0A2G5BJW1_COERN|nr:protein disulfide isomerase [Coemansia reversa NRRL 1564]|eukprot:PIA19027.1 protein disulfide isomerase [Coemansia reversa NRRL 1564]
MRTTFLRIALSTVAVVALLGTGAAKSDVTVLNASNFNKWTSAQNLALVEFMAPWCMFCQSLAPAYQAAGTALKKDKVPLAIVDCTVDDDICDLMNIDGYPTLKVVSKGTFAPYNGTREESGIISYMLKHKQPPLPEIPAAKLEEFKGTHGTAVVGYLESSSSIFGTLEDIARELRDQHSFGYTPSKKLAKQQGVPAPGIAIYNSDNHDFEVFTGEVTPEAVRQFVKSVSVPVLGELSSQTFKSYINTDTPIGLIFYNSEASRKELEKMLFPVAREFRRAISMAFVDARIYSRHARMLDLKPQWPSFAIQSMATRTKFLFSQSMEISETNIRHFVSSFVEGKLLPDYKSEPIPSKNDGGVFSLVAKQFNDIVFDPTKDVLIMFYSPACIHCRRMAPAYEELGEKLKGSNGVLIAKMDATINDIPTSDPDMEISGYPTILLVRANDNRVISYSGDRSVQSFVDFLKLNAIRFDNVQDGGVEKVDSDPAYVPMSNHDVGFTPKETRHIEL